MEITIESLTHDLKEEKDKISQLRKKGFNTKIPEMKIMNIPYKLQMAKITAKKRDLQIVANLIDEVRKELTEIEDEKGSMQNDLGKEAEEAYRKELEALKAKESGKQYENLDQDEIITKTNKLINDAYANLDNQNFDKSLHLYIEIKNIYKYLPKTLKSQYYQDAINIHKALLESGLFDKITAKQGFFQKLRSRFFR